MTKFDHLYIDPNAENDLQEQVDLVDDWTAGTRSDPWRDALSNPNVGNSVVVNGLQNFSLSDPSTVRPVEICRVQVPAHLSRPWVVSWSPVRTPVAGLSLDLSIQGRSYAVIRWGAGGFRHEAWVDWGRGGQATMYGSYVQVNIQPLDMLLPPNPSMVAGASIAPGLGPPRSLQSSLYLGTINAGASLARPIPPFATQVWVMAGPPTGGTGVYELRFRDVNGAIVSEVQGTFSVSANERTWQPIPGEATQIDFLNGSAGNYPNVTAMFQLAI